MVRRADPLISQSPDTTSNRFYILRVSLHHEGSHLDAPDRAIVSTSLLLILNTLHLTFTMLSVRGVERLVIVLLTCASQIHAAFEPLSYFSDFTEPCVIPVIPTLRSLNVTAVTI